MEKSKLASSCKSFLNSHPTSKNTNTSTSRNPKPEPSSLSLSLPRTWSMTTPSPSSEALTKVHVSSSLLCEVDVDHRSVAWNFDRKLYDSGSDRKHFHLVHTSFKTHCIPMGSLRLIFSWLPPCWRRTVETDKRVCSECQEDHQIIAAVAGKAGRHLSWG